MRVFGPLLVAFLLLLLGTSAAAKDGLLGVVVPARRVELSAPFAARVQQVNVALGDSVAAGQLLVELEIPGLLQEIARAEAAIRGAAAKARQFSIELADIERQLGRRSETDDVFSEEELQALEVRRNAKHAELEGANASSEERRAELELLRTQLKESQVRAPFDGVIARRECVQGASVGANDVLLQLIDADAAIIRFAVPPEELHWARPGVAISVELQGGDGTRHPARIERVAPELDPAIAMCFAEGSFVGTPIEAGAVVRIHKP